MKLECLKKFLEDKGLKKLRELKNKFSKKKKEKKEQDLNKIKVIGITGSRGKSSVAYMLHENLKALGYKSVLYSSLMVDSPESVIRKNEAYELAIRSEEDLLSIIEEAAEYGADYLVLEVNESVIEKRFLDNVDFTVKVLTSLSPKHNLEQYTEDEYVKIKKSFFQNINKDCKCVIGLQDYDKELFNELLNANECSKYTFTSNYIAKVKGVDPALITCLLTDLESSLDGLTLTVRLDDKSYIMNTPLIGNHNTLNISCVMAILKALDVFNYEAFKECMKTLNLPGRCEIKKVNNRLIVIDNHMSQMLEVLTDFKEKGLIDKIKVVIGSSGYGYKNWHERFKTEEYKESRKVARRYAMNLLKDKADYVYLTESDNAAESVLAICTFLQNCLDDEVPSLIIEERRDAIRKALRDSKENDAILIAGRGNRIVSCNSDKTIKLINDLQIVEDVLKELGW